MSKESYIGGMYIETTGGDCKNYSGGDFVNYAEQQFIQNADNGIFYGTNGAPPIITIPLDTECLVQFRPQNGWKGEFGFDWFRIEDTEKICGVNIPGDIDYENSIGLYDKYPSIQSARFSKDNEMVNKLKSDYGNVYSTSWLQKDNAPLDYIVPCIIAPQFRIVTL